MKRTQFLLALAMLLGVAAHAQTSSRAPHIGYVFPAGGQQGTQFTVTVGGQYLNGVKAAWISGAGVEAEFVYHARFIRNLNGDQRRILQRKLLENRARLKGEAAPSIPKSLEVPDGVSLPRHPLLDDIDQLGLFELDAIERQFIKFDPKKQPNAQIGDTVKLKITIAANAAPGDREIRLDTPTGPTNALCFQVGVLPELSETEPNDPTSSATAKSAPLALPVLVNGQVEPGDVDRFPFRAKKGQRLVVEAQARHLIPFLADAVPGWFQATLALYDEAGKEVAFADDFHFHPDPVIYYEVPRDGVYEVEIRDAIYRGREDFVYRVSIAERPFVTSIFPLGGKANTSLNASIKGWNLPADTLALDTTPQRAGIREAVLRAGKLVSNPMPYVVDQLPEIFEQEPNNTSDLAQAVKLPAIVNGRIDTPGDTDFFRVEGRAGMKLVAEVVARRLHSPLDALVRVMDADGKVLDWNDDHETLEGHLRIDTGVMTDAADPYLMVELPADGTYYVQVVDARDQGGAAHAYRLRLSPPRPDFELRVTPSTAQVRPGASVPIWVYALRKDGFQGEIVLEAQARVEGFSVSGGLIQKGQDRARVMLTAPSQATARPVAVTIVGSAQAGSREIQREAVPTEDRMQAFLYQHLVPVRELLVAVRGTVHRPPEVSLLKEESVAIPAGGSAVVLLKAPQKFDLKNLRLDLFNPPEGIKLQKTTPVDGGLTLLLAADGKAARPGLADNLFIEAVALVDVKNKDGKPTGEKRRTPLGYLPAIPFHVVSK